MKKISLNQGWVFTKGTAGMMERFSEEAEKLQTVNLPHDAMIYQERTPDTANGHQTGFYPGGEYTYLKHWKVPEEWRGRTVVLEFEGIADTCRIYLNGSFLLNHVNPYTGIWADVTKYLKYGEVNDLKAEVISVEQSSRWYSGAGLYRPVNVWVGGPVHIPAEGVRIRTSSADQECAVAEAEITVWNKRPETVTGEVEIFLQDPSGTTVTKEKARVTFAGESTQKVYQSLTVLRPQLWSDKNPCLYTCTIKISENGEILDSVSIPVGIRTLRLNAAEGLLLNGEPVKLRGTCIHHDNGILEAPTLSTVWRR